MRCNPIPMSGKMLKTIIANIADKPASGDSSRNANQSVSIGSRSLIATDNRALFLAGQPDESYVGTLRESALTEAARAEIYKDTVSADHIDRLSDTDGCIVDNSYIKRPLKLLDEMQMIGVVNPKLLLTAARVAVAAGATSMTLYSKTSTIGEDDAHSTVYLGASFKYTFDVDQLTLNLDDVPEDESVDIEELYKRILEPVPCRLLLAGMRNSLAEKSEPDESSII